MPKGQALLAAVAPTVRRLVSAPLAAAKTTLVPPTKSFTGIPLHPAGGATALNRGYVSPATYAKLPVAKRAEISANQMTPQPPVGCHQRVDRHLTQAAAIAQQSRTDPVNKAIAGVMDAVGSREKTNNRDTGQHWLNDGRPFALRSNSTPTSQSPFYRNGDHSVAVHGTVPDPQGGNERMAVLQDPDHRHHPETRSLIEAEANRLGVEPHELTAEQINSMPGGGPHLLTRLVPENQITEGPQTIQGLGEDFNDVGEVARGEANMFESPRSLGRPKN